MQVYTNLSNNMQIKNNRVSKLELPNKLAKAFSRPSPRREGKGGRQLWGA